MFILIKKSFYRTKLRRALDFSCSATEKVIPIGGRAMPKLSSGINYIVCDQFLFCKKITEEVYFKTYLLHFQNKPWKILDYNLSSVNHTQVIWISLLPVYLYVFNIAQAYRLYNQKDGTYFKRDINKVFHPTRKDWGFSKYKDWSEVVDPENGFIKVK